MLFSSSSLATLAVILGLAQTALSHPGEKIDALQARWEAHVRHTAADINGHALSKCEDVEEINARRQRAKERRMATFEKLRADKGLHNGMKIV